MSCIFHTSVAGEVVQPFSESAEIDSNGKPTMKLSPKFNAMPVLVAVSLCCGLTAARASAETMHTPTKMPTAKAESVGMSTEGLNRIDEVMQEHIDAGHIQGAVTIVARRGKVVHFSTHGDMDVKKSRAMEPDAIYRMASSTKPVIGVAAMMMVDEGLISLSDPVSKYIPEFADMKVAVLEPAANSSQGNSRKSLKQKSSKQKNFKKEVPKHRLVPVDTPMTIHHLLTHTSGLMSGGLGSAVNPVKRTSDDTLETYVAKLAKVPLDFQPGTRWAYGNAGIHAVVPRIIEIVSETPFEEFVRERVLNPLEMNNSYFSLPSDKESKRVVVMFKGREVKKKKGGTGLSSTAEDYLHFQQMLLNGGEFFGNRLLRPESVEMMSSNQVGDLFTRGKKGQKGMGFGYTVAVTLDPDVVANHRGKGAFGWGGAGGTMSWTDPENELVAVLMLQQPHGRTQRDFGEAVRQAVIE
jgi:CubicO group peptidase (beta-lactamase class C family)